MSDGGQICNAARRIGERAARLLFDARSKGHKAKVRNVEIHITEADLALAIATGAQAGINAAVKAAAAQRQEEIDAETERASDDD